KNITLSWLAVRQDRVSFQSVQGMEYEHVLHHELDEQTIKHFQLIVKEKGVDPNEYFFMPIHEWQWRNIIVLLFAEELAEGAIILLGEAPDNYLPGQSIRTF